jgi:thioredoxin 1
MADNVIELTDATFDNTVHDSDVPVLVDFWAPWCGPCRMIAPIIHEIADEYAGKARVCRLNTDDARDSAMEFGISAIPTIILFKDGQVGKKWVGLTSKKEISAAIDELL